MRFIPTRFHAPLDYIVGVALIGVNDRGPLLAVLATAGRAVARATNFVVALTPYGVFAIAAVVAGTLSLEELERLEVYLVTYVSMSLLLALWVLPGLVAGRPGQLPMKRTAGGQPRASTVSLR